MAMTQHQTLTPADDYETVRAAIAYLSETGAEDVDLARFARSLGMTERQLTDLFRRWCGLSPKSFAQAVALNHAKRLLADKASVLSFVVDGIHAHDLGTIVDREGVAIRTGHHCAMPVMERFGVAATARASFAFYNNQEDVDRLMAGLKKAVEIFRG